MDEYWFAKADALGSKNFSIYDYQGCIKERSETLLRKKIFKILKESIGEYFECLKLVFYCRLVSISCTPHTESLFVSLLVKNSDLGGKLYYEVQLRTELETSFWYSITSPSPSEILIPDLLPSTTYAIRARLRNGLVWDKFSSDSESTCTTKTIPNDSVPSLA